MTTDDALLWRLEETLWTGGLKAMVRHLAPGCLMALPGIGILSGRQILNRVETAPQWQDMQRDEAKLSRHHGAVVLAYRATARGQDGTTYRCNCTSSWVPQAGSWKIIQHQQTAA